MQPSHLLLPLPSFNAHLFFLSQLIGRGQLLLNLLIIQLLSLILNMSSFRLVYLYLVLTHLSIMPREFFYHLLLFESELFCALVLVFNFPAKLVNFIIQFFVIVLEFVLVVVVSLCCLLLPQIIHPKSFLFDSSHLFSFFELFLPHKLHSFGLYLLLKLFCSLKARFVTLLYD